MEQQRQQYIIHQNLGYTLGNLNKFQDSIEYLGKAIQNKRINNLHRKIKYVLNQVLHQQLYEVLFIKQLKQFKSAIEYQEEDLSTLNQYLKLMLKVDSLFELEIKFEAKKLFTRQNDQDYIQEQLSKF